MRTYIGMSVVRVIPLALILLCCCSTTMVRLRVRLAEPERHNLYIWVIPRDVMGVIGMYSLLFDTLLWPLDGVASLSRIAKRPDSVRSRVPVLGDMLAVALPFMTNFTINGDREDLTFPLVGRFVPVGRRQPFPLKPGAGVPEIVAAMATTWGLTDEEAKALAGRVVEAEWVIGDR